MYLSKPPRKLAKLAADYVSDATLIPNLRGDDNDMDDEELASRTGGYVSRAAYERAMAWVASIRNRPVDYGKVLTPAPDGPTGWDGLDDEDTGPPT